MDSTYHIANQLGEGSYGTVFKCAKGGKLFALKRTDNFMGVHPSTLKEIAFLRMCNHKHVISLVEVQLSCFKTDIILELAERTMLDVIHAGEYFSIQLRDDHIKQLLLGVEYLHEFGIIHRDIKPANTLVVKGEIKIADFGLSLCDDGEVYDSSVQTPWYRAPEVWLDCTYQTPAIDMWSVGCVIYQMTTTRPLSALPRNHTPADALKEIMSLVSDVIDTTDARVNNVWNEVRFDPKYKETVEQLRKFPPVPSNKLKTLDATATFLVGGMIQFRPSFRLSATEALYFLGVDVDQHPIRPMFPETQTQPEIHKIIGKLGWNLHRSTIERAAVYMSKFNAAGERPITSELVALTCVLIAAKVHETDCFVIDNVPTLGGYAGGIVEYLEQDILKVLDFQLYM